MSGCCLFVLVQILASSSGRDCVGFTVVGYLVFLHNSVYFAVYLLNALLLFASSVTLRLIMREHVTFAVSVMRIL